MDIDYPDNAEELFAQYTKLLSGDFYTSDFKNDVERQCICIAEQLKELGFAIASTFDFSTEQITVSDDTTRTMITVQYNIMLLEGMPPRLIKTTSTQARAFGSIVPNDALLSTGCIPSEYEEFLQSLLQDSSNKEQSRQKGDTT